MSQLDDPISDWIEITGPAEMSEGKRMFVRGRIKQVFEVTPAAVEAFERFGTDNYGAIVDTRAGLIAALKQMGIPVKE